MSSSVPAPTGKRGSRWRLSGRVATAVAVLAVVFLVVAIIQAGQKPNDTEMHSDLIVSGIALLKYEQALDQGITVSKPQFPETIFDFSNDDEICLVGEGRSGYWGFRGIFGSRAWLFGYADSTPSGNCSSPDWTWSTDWPIPN